MSIANAQGQVQQQAAISVAKKAMNVAEQQMQGVVEMMQTAPSNARLDIRA